MMVGFFEKTIEGLQFFKKSVALYPNFDYVFYADTYYEINEAPTFIQRGIEWLSLKKVDVIMLGEGIDTDVARMYTSVPILQKNELLTSLGEMKTRLHVHEQGTLRHIHITEHNKEQDERIASLLGGLFVAE